ncbi:4'-phosphopantetheinyl transferase superfamily protein [Ruegeria halocynthiae]|uniref:Enterobactin synthase component D n=1 Tax=Ruegeria halocynthiae TaxID=985054 RepID=A0A1H2Y305_9RHOB|nr:4'-phosphopantetheinyl transferase superfamily protein [Ruegeria halocynthiae]SDW99516.1 4'-phosphopantetheinyl transferase superfamily protein [Ruegeria halocynthiae]
MSRLEQIRAELQNVLGPDIGVGVTDPKALNGALLPEEEPAMANALNKRRLEFASGRAAARQAMKDLNLPSYAIPMAADRSPVWPAGIVGSITHSDDICIAAVAHDYHKVSIGIDVEPEAPLGSEFEEIICTPSERAWLDTQGSAQHRRLATQIFCVKESIYKALYPLTGQVIGFNEVELELPFQNCTGFVLKANKQTETLSVETRLITIRNFIFTYAGFAEIPFSTAHRHKFYDQT